MSSVFPSAFAEAKRSTVTVSLALIGVIAYGAFYLGQQNTPHEVVREQTRLQVEIAANLAKTSETLSRLESEQRRIAHETQRDIAALREKADKTNAEVTVISSHLTPRR